jgi:hypothetical protein
MSNKKAAEAMAVAFAMCVALFSVYWGYAALSKPMPAPRPLCGVAEISPDITPEERKNCREMMRRSL